MQDIDGKALNLSSLKGKVVLVVNLASQCGFTPQYSELQAVYEKFGSQVCAPPTSMNGYNFEAAI